MISSVALLEDFLEFLPERVFGIFLSEAFECLSVKLDVYDLSMSMSF